MARMSIDDTIARDPRITVLAKLLGWSRRETVGCLVAEVWPVCYDLRTHLVSERLIDAAAAHDGFALAMLEAELARRDRSGLVNVTGAKERVAYLEAKSRAGRQGGLKSAESRALGAKQTSSTSGSTPQARRNPSVPDTATASAPSSATALDQNPDSDTLGSGRDRSVSRPRTRKTKPSEPTPDERAIAMRVLDKLGARTGTRYTGAAEHLKLITAQLRAGVTEFELRAVAAYCHEAQGWGSREKPEMAHYLRPETLYGPRTISRYLDHARTWAADAIAEAEKRERATQPPALELVP